MNEGIRRRPRPLLLPEGVLVWSRPGRRAAVAWFPGCVLNRTRPSV